MKKLIAVFALVLTFTSCDLLQQAGLPLTELDVANGLKEALVQGVNRGSSNLFNTQANGNSGLLNELLPENAANLLNVVKTLGLSPKLNQLNASLNTAAMNSVQKSVPIFVNAIRGISIVDAWNILRGNQNAATTYLRNATQANLVRAISPEVAQVFAGLGLKPTLMGNLGSKNPLLNAFDVDLTQVLTTAITQKMFAKIAEEEGRIRTNVANRTTSLMQRVFGAIGTGVGGAGAVPQKY
jgi:hypothetical protein